MKGTPTHSVLLRASILAAVLSVFIGNTHAANPAPAAAPVVEPPPSPRSTFSIDPKTSRDPFFPKSERAFKDIVVKTNDISVPPPPQFPEDIRCQGFSGTIDRPLVIINNKTVERGERFELLLRGGRTSVQCMGIDLRNKSVVLEVKGITRELTLRSTLR